MKYYVCLVPEHHNASIPISCSDILQSQYQLSETTVSVNDPKAELRE
ncbi:hypothetical protein M153_2700008691 [Pseudoloma neurophilia]|uniref:Uncharacterized protein n=1 Tax=Pseudoloma neurophilia TaxID=146866 RepID=A0A0R0LZ73_9MICR|nr:hypothetical protein M153_2700008691 [Pseudoloma neurophilia]